MARIKADNFMPTPKTPETPDGMDNRTKSVANTPTDDKVDDKKEPMKKAAKEKKEETEYNYVNTYLDELKKTTMGSYIAKASKDLADRRFDQGDSEKRKYDPDEADEKEDKKSPAERSFCKDCGSSLWVWDPRPSITTTPFM